MANEKSWPQPGDVPSAVQITYAAGLRASELGRLKVTDIDSARICLRVDQGRGNKDPYGIRSTVVTSRLPLEERHDVVADPTLAEAILVRLVHSAHQIKLKGESMRKRRQALIQTTHHG